MNTSLPVLITSFFTAHLPNVAGYSENTVKSYRDTFVLLFSFADEQKLCPRGRINIDIFSRDILNGWKTAGMSAFQPGTSGWLP